MKQSLKGKRVSRADVAKAAGVAPCTVSIVLNDTPGGRVSKEVRKKIRHAAEVLGYRPSATARALVTGKTNTVALLMFQGGSPFADNYINGIISSFWKKINQKKYRTIIDSINIDDSASDIFIDNAADGIILLAPPREVTNLKLMTEANFPLVCVGNIPDCGNVNYVDLDNYQAGKDATKYLIENGHTQIAHLAGVIEHSSAAVERLNGYRDALTEAGIRYNPELVIHSEFDPEVSQNAARCLLGRGVSFSAVFAASDEGSQAVLDIMHEQEMTCPDDLSVITVKRSNSDKGCAVTGIINPLEEIGAITAELLLDFIDGKRNKPVERKIKGELFIGSTVKTI